MTLESAFKPDMSLVVELSADSNGYSPVSDEGCAVKNASFSLGDAVKCQIKSSKKQITISGLVKEAIPAGSAIELELS